MATVIKLKRSTTADSVPTTSDLADGEVAINLADKKIYVNNGGTIVEVANAEGAAGNPGSFTTLTASGATTLNGSVSLGGAIAVLLRSGIPFYKTGDLSTSNATFDLKASGGGERIFNDFTLATGSAITTQEKTLFSF